MDKMNLVNPVNRVILSNNETGLHDSQDLQDSGLSLLRGFGFFSSNRLTHYDSHIVRFLIVD